MSFKGVIENFDASKAQTIFYNITKHDEKIKCNLIYDVKLIHRIFGYKTFDGALKVKGIFKMVLFILYPTHVSNEKLNAKQNLIEKYKEKINILRKDIRIYNDEIRDLKIQKKKIQNDIIKGLEGKKNE